MRVPVAAVDGSFAALGMAATHPQFAIAGADGFVVFFTALYFAIRAYETDTVQNVVKWIKSKLPEAS